MKLLLAISSLLAFAIPSNTQADQIGEDIGGGLGWFEPGYTFEIAKSSQQELKELYETAGRHPNASSAVTFGQTSGWTWRVNLTDLAVPASIFPGNKRVLNEQWELQWPGGGSFGNLLLKTPGYSNNTKFCTQSIKISLPSNVTSRYSASDNGNCSAVLGYNCTQALDIYLLSSCNNSPYVPQNLEACADTLNIGKVQTDGRIQPSSNASVQSGNTFYYEISPALSATNITDRFDRWATQLNILVFNSLPGTKDVSGTILCQVVQPPTSSGASSQRPWATANIFMLSLAVGCAFVFL